MQSKCLSREGKIARYCRLLLYESWKCEPGFTAKYLPMTGLVQLQINSGQEFRFECLHFSTFSQALATSITENCFQFTIHFIFLEDACQSFCRSDTAQG